MSAIEAVALSHIMAYRLGLGLGSELGSEESAESSSFGGWGATIRVNEDREGAAAAPLRHEEDDEEEQEQDDDDEGFKPAEVLLIGRDSIADLPTREKALSEYTGHYDTALHRLQVALTWQVPGKSPSQGRVPHEERHHPKTELSSLLKWKLLTILAARPGLNLLSIHRALHLLDLPKTLELLDSLRTEGAITRSAAAITDRYPALRLKIRDPFAASQAIFSFFSDQASLAGSNGDDNATVAKNWRYFIAF